MSRLNWTIAVVLCVSGNLLAANQSDRWLREVRALLREAGAVLERRGYELTHEVQTGSLRDGQADTFTVILEPRPQPYTVIGVCDTDCSDLDLTITDLYGQEVDQDIEPDDQPMLLVQVTTRTRYRVRVSMADCSSSPCFFGVGIFGR